jgi:nucleotide-binding universal stress UspA family protein
MSTSFVIVVPVDFTKAAVRAVEYAIGFSSKMNAKITLLHVVSKESEIKDANEHIAKFISESMFNTAVETAIVVGNYLTDIGTISESLSADLIIMGTHGEKGVQKVFGSYALRVVESSKIPLLIVQEETIYRAINRIVMTIDLERESIQIVKTSSQIAKFFDAEIILIGGKHSDPLLKKKVSMNMLLCKEFLTSEKVNFKIELLERKHFDENLIQYCANNEIDMIAATFYQNTFYAFSDKFVQHLIMNELHIPMMTIDSTSTGHAGQLSFMT